MSDTRTSRESRETFNDPDIFLELSGYLAAIISQTAGGHIGDPQLVTWGLQQLRDFEHALGTTPNRTRWVADMNRIVNRVNRRKKAARFPRFHEMVRNICGMSHALASSEEIRRLNDASGRAMVLLGILEQNVRSKHDVAQRAYDRERAGPAARVRNNHR